MSHAKLRAIAVGQVNVRYNNVRRTLSKCLLSVGDGSAVVYRVLSTLKKFADFSAKIFIVFNQENVRSHALFASGLSRPYLLNSHTNPGHVPVQSPIRIDRLQ